MVIYLSGLEIRGHVISQIVGRSEKEYQLTLAGLEQKQFYESMEIDDRLPRFRRPELKMMH